MKNCEMRRSNQTGLKTYLVELKTTKKRHRNQNLRMKAGNLQDTVFKVITSMADFKCWENKALCTVLAPCQRTP